MLDRGFSLTREQAHWPVPCLTPTCTTPCFAGPPQEACRGRSSSWRPRPKLQVQRAGPGLPVGSSPCRVTHCWMRPAPKHLAGRVGVARAGTPVPETLRRPRELPSPEVLAGSGSWEAPVFRASARSSWGVCVGVGGGTVPLALGAPSPSQS